MTQQQLNQMQEYLKSSQAQTILNEQDFYHQKAKDALEDWRKMKIDPKRLDNLINNFDYNSFKNDPDVKDIRDCIFRLVACCDEKANEKEKFNPGKRVIAKASIRQNTWVLQLLKFKKDENSVLDSISNVIKYMDAPDQNFPIVSEKHKKQIAKNLLNKSYDPNQFSKQLSDFFDNLKLTFTLKNASNKMKLYNKILYNFPEWWQDSKLYAKIFNLSELLSSKKNIILQGAPGTGKTYTTASIAVHICDNKDNKFADYSDHKKVMEEYESLRKNGQIAFCTFHQSMDYEDFVEGLRPQIKESNVEYNIQKGIFREICEKAKDELSKNYVLIIDEINRGNISKIFGELITLLEADKRTGAGEHSLTLKLPYSKDDFCVPSNLYIIGTMNTTDRSTGTIDYAVRRRFAFVTLETSPEVLENWCDSNSVKDDVKQVSLALFKEINNYFIPKHKAADFELEDLKVGHSYFMANDLNTLKLKMRYEVVPLIKEYQKDGILKTEKDDHLYFEKWVEAECKTQSTQQSSDE